jgi:hypothetical protein
MSFNTIHHLILVDWHERIGVQLGMLIVMVDRGFGHKQLQTYPGVYSAFFEIWLQTFINLLTTRFDEDFEK